MNKKVLLYKIVKEDSYSIGDIVNINIQERIDEFNRNIKFMNLSKVDKMIGNNQLNEIDIDNYLLLPEKDFMHKEKKNYKGTIVAIQDTILIKGFKQLFIEIT